MMDGRKSTPPCYLLNRLDEGFQGGQSGVAARMCHPGSVLGQAWWEQAQMVNNERMVEGETIIDDFNHHGG